MSVSLLPGSQFVSIKQYLPSDRALKQMYDVPWLLCFQTTLYIVFFANVEIEAIAIDKKTDYYHCQYDYCNAPGKNNN